MDETPPDIRTIPIPAWPTRNLSALQNGRWTYFYNSKDNSPLFNYEPYSDRTLSILTQRTPNGISTRHSTPPARCLTNNRSRKNNNNEDDFHFLDSYTLLKESIKKIEQQQKLSVKPSVTMPESQNVKTRDSPLEQTFVPSETNVVSKLSPIVECPYSVKTVVRSPKKRAKSIQRQLLPKRIGRKVFETRSIINF